MGVELIGTLVANVGVAGVLGWYLWYTASVQIPKAHNDHVASIEKLMDGFRTDIAEERHQRNGLYGTLRDLVEELRARPCIVQEPRGAKDIS
jgi:hypothetical protein